MRLLAISDVHVGHARNREAIHALPDHGRDWLIVAGDVAETLTDVADTLDALGRKFDKLFWVPGNHELWTVTEGGLAGAAKYAALVALCRERGVHTPEDPFVVWPGPGGPRIIAPLFVLYDYSFAPAGMRPAEALAWAREEGLVCADEHLLHSAPFPDKASWCAARCAYSELRLDEASRQGLPMVLVNHFPLRREHAFLPRIPRFAIWCGTERTADWHTRFGAEVVVFGHLHIRQTRHLDGVRFEEVSLGYPRQWQADTGLEPYLRTIL